MSTVFSVGFRIYNFESPKDPFLKKRINKDIADWAGILSFVLISGLCLGLPELNIPFFFSLKYCETYTTSAQEQINVYTLQIFVHNQLG
jgi:hypothetical protein